MRTPYIKISYFGFNFDWKSTYWWCLLGAHKPTFMRSSALSANTTSVYKRTNRLKLCMSETDHLTNLIYTYNHSPALKL